MKTESQSMNPAIVSSLVSGGSGLLSTGLQLYANKKFYAKQHKDNIQDWYRENQYNSPSAQMSRLKAAGLNPNLVYQSGNAVNPAGAIEPGQLGNHDFSAIAGAGSDISRALIDSYYRNQELEQNETNIMSLVAYRAFLNEFNESKTAGQNTSNEKAVAEKPYFDQNAYFDFLNKKQMYENAQQTYKRLEAETALTWSQNRYTQQGIRNLKKQYHLTDTQIKSLEEGMRKMQTEQWEILFNAGLNKMKYDLSEREKNAVIAKYSQEITNLQFDCNRIQAETENIHAGTAQYRTNTAMKDFMASGRERLAEDLRGEHGIVNQVCAEMLYNVFEMLDKLPFTGKFNF